MQQDDDVGKRTTDTTPNQVSSYSIKDLIQNALIIHTDVQREYYASEEEFIAESDVIDRAKEIQEVLESQGVFVTVLPWSNQIPLQIYQDRPDIVINMVETIKGSTPAASAVPAMLELMEVPYTGSSNKALLQSSNKTQVKDLLFEYDLPTPQYELVTDITDKIPKAAIEFPMIIKPNINMGGSVGIDDTSVCTNWKQVYTKINQLLDNFDIPVLAEEFIEGRELTAVMVQAEDDLRLYVGEKVFKDKPDKRQFNFLSWDAVWDEEDAFDYAPYVDKTGYLSTICREAFDVLDLSCYVKIDIRLNKQNRPYIIDVNPDCSLGPKNEAIHNVPALFGVTFEETLYHIIKSGLNRKST